MKAYLEKAIQLLGADGWDRTPALAYQLHFDMFIGQVRETHTFLSAQVSFFFFLFFAV